MSFIKEALESLVGAGVEVFDDLHTSEEEKATAKLRLEKVLTARMISINEAVEARLAMVADIIKSEMASGDNYTKRARPTLVYFGMLVIFFNYCLVPAVQAIGGGVVEPFVLPMEFWIAWGGTVGIWSAGRTAERTIGAETKKQNPVLDKVLGAING
tara:strand:- start:232 stop:702 length:471 start_codon:yes stop_codon:yes gene_type:complete